MRTNNSKKSNHSFKQKKQFPIEQYDQWPTDCLAARGIVASDFSLIESAEAAKAVLEFVILICRGNCTKNSTTIDAFSLDKSTIDRNLIWSQSKPFWVSTHFPSMASLQRMSDSTKQLVSCASQECMSIIWRGFSRVETRHRDRLKNWIWKLNPFLIYFKASVKSIKSMRLS